MSLGLITLFSSLGYFECDMPGMALTGEARLLSACAVSDVKSLKSLFCWADAKVECDMPGMALTGETLLSLARNLAAAACGSVAIAWA